MNRRKRSTSSPRMSADQRRTSILKSTIACISKFGFWGFTIRDVAEAEGVTEAGLLYYFKSKEELLVKTLEYADIINAEAIAKRLGISEETDISDGLCYHGDFSLKTLTTATVEVNVSRPQLVSLYIVLQGESLEDKHPAHQFFLDREQKVLHDYAYVAKRDGLENPDRIALQTLSAMDGLQLRWLTGGKTMDFVDEWKRFINIIIPD